MKGESGFSKKQVFERGFDGERKDLMEHFTLKKKVRIGPGTLAEEKKINMGIKVALLAQQREE